VIDDEAEIVDMRIPGLDGPSLYRAAAQHDPMLPARFIVITGDTLRPETRAFLDATGAPVVHKPFEGGEVERIILETFIRAAGSGVP
jgi:hypothetical protein